MEEEIKKWKRRIRAFKAWRKKQIDDKLNERFVKLYENKPYTPKGTTRGDMTSVNLVFVYVDIIMASISKARPTPVAEPRDKRFYQEVNAAEAVLDYEIIETNVKEEVDKAFLDALLRDEGGFVKIGYSSEWGKKPKHADIDGYRRGVKKGEAVEYDDYIKSEHPFVKRIAPEDFGFDWTCTELSEAEWVFLKFKRKAADVRDDPAYDENARKMLANRYSTEELKGDQEVELVEIWDKKTHQTMVFALEGEARWLVAPAPWPVDCEGFPFAHLKFNLKRNSVYGLAPVRMFYSIVDELNRLRNTFLRKSRRTIPRWLATENALTEEGADALEDENEMTVVTVRQSVDDIRDLPQPNVPNDERHLQAELKDDFRFISGISEQQAGVGSKDSPTATEVLSRTQFSQSRIGRMRTRYERFWSEILRKMLLIIKAFYPPEKVVPIYNPEGRIEDWTKWSDEWRKAEYDIIGVEAGSTSPPSREAQQQRFMQLSQTIPQMAQALSGAAQMLQQQGITMDVPAFMRELLRPFKDEISTWDEIFPGLEGGQDPHVENRLLLQGQDVYVLPEDDDKRHFKVCLLQLQKVKSGEFGDVPDEIIRAHEEHLMQHQAAMAVAEPNSPDFPFATQMGAQQMAQQQMGGPNGQAMLGGQAAMERPEGMGSEQMMQNAFASPTGANAFANAGGVQSAIQRAIRQQGGVEAAFQGEATP